MNAIKSFFRKIENKAKFYAFVFSLWRNPWTRSMVKPVMRTYRKAQKLARHVRKIGPSVCAAVATGENLEQIAAMYGMIRSAGESDDRLRERIMDKMEPRSRTPRGVEMGRRSENELLQVRKTVL